MKLANIKGRAHWVTPQGGVDIAHASDGRFAADMKSLLGELQELKAWLLSAELTFDATLSIGALDKELERLDAPLSNPSQIFAVGLNYSMHGAEVEMAIPDQPMIFTKFQSSIGAPSARVALPTQTCDWEVELVAVIGKGGRNITKANALAHVAGFCVGQDYSERALQMANQPPQFSLAKSYPNFAPIGPWITTAEEVDPASLTIRCRHQDAVLQDGHTSQMIFDVPTLIAYLSGICELRTGDLIFTGTPAGVGLGYNPPRYIQNGWVIESSIEGLGRLENACEWT